MSERYYRVLIVASHPVQYSVPGFRLMARHPQLDILVAYCSMQGAKPVLDPEFGVEVVWDIPLLDDYPWIEVPNRSPKPGLGHFWGLLNPDLWYLITARRFDAVIIFTGYMHASFWIALAAAKLSGAAVLFGTDAQTLYPLDRKSWKQPLKARFWPFLFRLADVVVVPSRGSFTLIESLGIPSEHIVLTPYVVDNDWWLQQAAQVDRSCVRAAWNIPEHDSVALFSAKLQPWKRPQDLLHAFAQARMPAGWLVYVGEGAMRHELEALARSLNVADRVRFLGFVNQSRMTEIYVAADLLVLPSEYDAFGVVVNEMMLCGHPVVVSDQVGAGVLVQSGETGFIYPCGDVDQLATLLRQLLTAPEQLRQMGITARQRMETWSPRENVAATFQAIEKAIARKRGNHRQ